MQLRKRGARRRVAALLLAGTLALLTPAVAPATADTPTDATATAASAAADPVPVASYDFEDATTQGWTPRGAAQLAVTDDAHGGTGALATTGRTDTWHGPARDVLGLLQTNATYLITGYARLAAGQPATDLALTMQRTPVDADTTWERIASAPATDAEWVRLQGEYTFTSDASELQLYLEATDATSAYLLDDLTITMTAPPPDGPPDRAGVVTDFETGTAQGWAPRIGSESVSAVATPDAHGGTHALLTTDRTASYAGPAFNLLGRMRKGDTYTLSAWTRLAPGQSPTALRMSIERRWEGTPSYTTVVGDTTVTADGWVNLRGSYTLVHDVDFLSVYLEGAAGVSFYLDDFELAWVEPTPIQTDIPALRDAFPEHVRVGGAVERPETVGVHAELLERHYDSVTAGNAMKWDATEPTEGQFTWDEADHIVEYARENGLGVRGHTLVWHNQTPAWVFRDADGAEMTPTPENKALLLARLEAHIRAVAGRYADDVYAWDVVNEVIDESQPDGMRRSKWYEITGLDYIRTAFRVAREVAPDAKLYINDYNTEIPAKRAFLHDLVAQLKAEGVPVDGVGHQMHINIAWPAVGEIERTITDFVDLDVEQQITEFDMSVYDNPTDSYDPVPAELLVEQGYRYRDVFAALRRQADHLTGITFWGLGDDRTWLTQFPIARIDLPLPFDQRLQAKPAYWGIVDPTRLPPPAVTAECAASYRVVARWTGGFQVEVQVRNTGTTPIDGWTVTWPLPAGQSVSGSWSSALTVADGGVTARNLAWNGRLAAGAGTSFGFTGTAPGSGDLGAAPAVDCAATAAG
ncbi:endo-1,4-beta-xylanase [Allostreptomyces psammosilenae]|uniref:Beta-xylanase n=1 Tax=Allostreptomyces psammosilenae TaxID=1892865 RepID=A0A852ZMV2_9ACTN|nr:endo-1,4-beta-xylanase [Allostreptomyces psammosilenae]NYI03743.1 GH35 family endo-1,4-beta-xylanase [Allostreptomyces psammosilenae]